MMLRLPTIAMLVLCAALAPTAAAMEQQQQQQHDGHTFVQPFVDPSLNGNHHTTTTTTTLEPFSEFVEEATTWPAQNTPHLTGPMARLAARMPAEDRAHFMRDLDVHSKTLSALQRAVAQAKLEVAGQASTAPLVVASTVPQWPKRYAGMVSAPKCNEEVQRELGIGKVFKHYLAVAERESKLSLLQAARMPLLQQKAVKMIALEKLLFLQTKMRQHSGKNIADRMAANPAVYNNVATDDGVVLKMLKLQLVNMMATFKLELIALNKRLPVPREGNDQVATFQPTDPLVQRQAMFELVVERELADLQANAFGRTGWMALTNRFCNTGMKQTVAANLMSHMPNFRRGGARQAQQETARSDLRVSQSGSGSGQSSQSGNAGGPGRMAALKAWGQRKYQAFRGRNVQAL